jgi:hypothetical protein
MPQVTVDILQDGSKAEEGVDERLLKLAKKYQASICTLDFNLSKVATVENIVVLNINGLAQSLRMAYLPGERMLLELVQKGQDGHQAVGYLTDGTMVVVEHANKHIGQTVEIEFIRSLQTAAGKMMFAKRVEQKVPAPVIKPIGKKPVIKDAMKEKPSEQSAPKRRTGPSRRPEAPTATVKAQPAATAKPPVAAPKARQVSKRPRTQAQREASFIDLVDKQSE